MAINYTWDVNTCDVYPTKSGKSNVVYNVHWRIKATDDSNNDADGNPQKSEVYGTQELDTSDLSSFTNWSSLDAATVQSWVEATMNAKGLISVDDYKAKLDAEIANKISPSSVTKKLG
jgi:hypothetical protein|tara:strand:+ start:1023 stop:1376 length:354 start_codon:yes stop_codon:yes gene_type:complete